MNPPDSAGRAPGRSQAGPHPLGGSADVPIGRGAVMTGWEIAGAALAAGLLVYLVAVLLRPEDFS